MRYKKCCILIALLAVLSARAETNAFIPKPSLHGESNHYLQNPKPVKDNIPTFRWLYGLNLGVYFAHASTANYYNGMGEHSVSQALNRDYNYDKLVSNITEIAENFNVGDLPQSMHYSPAVQVGFFGGISFNNSIAILGEFNYTKLSAADKFTLFTDQYTSTSEPYRLLSDIYATEERIDLRLGFQYTLIRSSYIHPFIESGLSITDTKIIENKVSIRAMEFNIRELRTEYYGIRDYGLGFGLYTALGATISVSNDFSFRMGTSVNFSQINLGDNTAINPQYTLFVRLNLHEILSSSQPSN